MGRSELGWGGAGRGGKPCCSLGEWAKVDRLHAGRRIVRCGLAHFDCVVGTTF